MSDTAVIEPGAPPEGEGGQTPPEAPPTTEAPSDKVLDLLSVSLPLARFPRPEDLVGERVDDALVGSIEQTGGLMQPIVVAAPKDADLTTPISNDRIIAGRRRLQALWRLHERDAQNGDSRWHNVPVRIVVAEGEGVDVNATLLSLVDHAVRRDNDAMTYAAVFKLTQQDGYDQKKLKDATGMSLQTIQRIQRLSKLIDAFQKAMFEGKISGWVASKLSAFTQEEQVTLYEKFEREGKLTTAMLDDIRRAQRADASGATIDEVIEKVEQGGQEPPAPEESLPFKALQARVAELEAENTALRAESEARLVRIEEARAEGERVAGELRSAVDERNRKIEDLQRALNAAEAEHEANDPAEVVTIKAQYESALLDIERLERTVKLRENDVARARKQTLPHPDLAKVRDDDD